MIYRKSALLLILIGVVVLGIGFGANERPVLHLIGMRLITASSNPSYPEVVYFSIPISSPSDVTNPTLSIDFGDGTRGVPGLESVNCGRQATCLGGGFGASHQYAAAGTYTVRLTRCSQQDNEPCAQETLDTLTVTVP